MARIIDFGSWAEVVDDSGNRLFCHASVEKAQVKWDAEARESGLAHLHDATPLQVEKATPERVALEDARADLDAAQDAYALTCQPLAWARSALSLSRSAKNRAAYAAADVANLDALERVDAARERLNAAEAAEENARHAAEETARDALQPALI